MSHNSVCYAMLVLVSGLLGCGGGDSPSKTGEHSAATIAQAEQPGDPPTASPTGQQPAAQPRGASSLTGPSEGEPFDVEQFLESRAAPEDNAAPLYIAVLNERSPSLKEIELLADVKKLQSGATTPQQVEQALRSAAPVLAQIDAAQTKPSCVFVTEIGNDVLLPHVQNARSIARASLVELYWARVNDDPELAASAIKRVLRLSRDLRPRGFLVSQAVSMAIDGVMLSGIETFTLNDPKLTAEQCDQVLALLVEHQQQGLDRYQEGLRMEYIMTRHMIDDLQTGQMSTELRRTMDEWNLNRSPQSITYRAERSACDRVFSIALQEAGKPHHELAVADKLQMEQLRLANEARQGKGAAIVPMYVPALQVTRDVATRAKANLAGVQLLIALRRYELAHGKLPASLDEAVAETVLKTAPTDPYSGQPMRFAIVNRKATVYSTGPDLKDDGGRIEWKSGNTSGDYLFAMGPLPGVRPPPPATKSAPPETQAAPVPETAEVRSWTSTVGSTLEAEFTGVEDEVALLKKRDGTVIRVPLEKLSDQDRAWIQKQSANR